MKTRMLVSILIFVIAVLLINSCARLMQSAKRGDYAKANRLIEEGKDVNAEDIYGLTALMYASREGHTEVAKLLIEAGVK